MSPLHPCRGPQRHLPGRYEEARRPGGKVPGAVSPQRVHSERRELRALGASSATLGTMGCGQAVASRRRQRAPGQSTQGPRTSCSGRRTPASLDGTGATRDQRTWASLDCLLRSRASGRAGRAAAGPRSPQVRSRRAPPAQGPSPCPAAAGVQPSDPTLPCPRPCPAPASALLSLDPGACPSPA